MKVTIIAVGTKMDRWIEDSCQNYINRLPKKWELRIIEIVQKNYQSNQSSKRAIELECETIVKKIDRSSYVVALDSRGESLTSSFLSKRISRWQMEGLNLTFVIGGPDGLSKEFLNECDFVWSMSDLTFPHPLVRVILLEQLYRAWTITTNHPYHRP